MVVYDSSAYLDLGAWRCGSCGHGYSMWCDARDCELSHGVAVNSTM